MTSPIRRPASVLWLMLWLTVASAASAQDFYAGAAAGRARYAIDCSGAPCDRGDSAYKLFGGWRAPSAPWGAEAMWADFGRASVSGTPSDAAYRKQALGIAATRRWPVGDWQASLRLGLAASRVEHAPFGAAAASRTSASGWLGASIERELTPRFGVRLDWDGVKGKTVASDNGDAGMVSLVLVARF